MAGNDDPFTILRRQPRRRSVITKLKERIVRIASYLRKQVRDVVRKRILNVQKPKAIPYVEQLKEGDKLCRERMIPMSSQLIKKLKQIYKNYNPFAYYSEEGDVEGTYNRGDTPLMMALKMGLMDLVWGFIECAKQTNSSLRFPYETGEHAVQEFLWYQNLYNGETAFDVAMAKNQMEVASVLLKNAPLWRLELEREKKGKNTLIPLFNSDPKYDRLIFYMLKRKWTPATSDDSPQESMMSREVLRKPNDGLLGLNPSKNSILHLASLFGDVKYAKEILDKHPYMISCRNSNGETPAYVAASKGHVDILQIMFQYMRKNEDIERENKEIESIVTRGMDKHNALHAAIQNHHVEVIFLLIEEIPQLTDRINDFNESPLYVAAERKYYGVLELMLKKHPKNNVTGPNGKTTLHAAAISNSPECIEYLLKERHDLLGVKDEYGWTPFRYAVYHNNSLATAKLLHMDYSIGYELMKEDDINTSPIHIAASRGHYETMLVLMSECPGCTEFIDSKGRNILHVAVENKKNQIIEFIFQDASLMGLINKKDDNGNTPIHLLVASDFEMMEKVMDFRVDINVINNEKKTPLDKTSSPTQREILIKHIAIGTRDIIIRKNIRSVNINKYAPKEMEYGDEEKEKEKEKAKEKELEVKKNEAEARFKIAENLVVVVALIATASFAAGITLPGGLHSNDDGSKVGTPFLLKKAAFKAFMVTNALAFCGSCSVLLIYIALILYRNQYAEASSADQEYVDDRIVDMYILTALALIAMAVAFVTGVYVVLTPSPALAISICVIGVLSIASGMRVMN